MATKKNSKAFVRLVRSMVRFTQRLSSKQAVRYYRNLFLLLIKPRRQGQMGFVLPTVTMLILVLGLVVSAMIFRGYNRSVDTIASFQEKRIDNAAAPAVDRATAKIRYLLSDDQPKEFRSPPREDELEAILLNQANGKYPNFVPSDKYTLADETQENIEDGGKKVPAWRYVTDTDGDGAKADDPDDITTIYGIFLRATRDNKDTVDINLDAAYPDKYELVENKREKRKEKLLVSRGPIANEASNPLCLPQYDDDTSDPALADKGPDGWFRGASSSFLRKNFQTFAIAVPNKVLLNNTPNLSVSTMEHQQDIIFELPGKYGAWFRYDIELYNGPPFTWNGAMHTEGSLFIRGRDGFRAFLISGPSSCFYNPSLNSEISLVKQLVWKIPGRPASEANQNGKIGFDVYKNNDPSAFLDETTDTSSASGNNSIDVSLDPVAIITKNESNYIGTGAGYQDKKLVDMNTGNAIGARVVRELKKDRTNGEDIEEKDADPTKIKCPPFLDDTYRADDRYGPKPNYNKYVAKNNRCEVEQQTVTGVNTGTTLSDPYLVRNTPPSTTKPDEYGLDGYWERRAKSQGLRIIVGQRLELGNPFGWGVSDHTTTVTVPTINSSISRANEPLLPPGITGAGAATGAYKPDFALPTNMSNRRDELLQRRTLRDNLAAVQATLVYSNNTSTGDTPVAVIATTVHPGTETTLKNSSTFILDQSLTNNPTRPLLNFFKGQGTNGWEFGPPDVSDLNMQNALNNLAHFAGDPGGAYPPTQDNIVHPYPLLTMWGDFSNLRRALSSNSSSLADNTTRQTAAATLGLLAYNMKYLHETAYESHTLLSNLNTELTDAVAVTPVKGRLQDDNPANGEIKITTTTIGGKNYSSMQVTPVGSTSLSTYKIPIAGPAFTDIPPEVYVSLLPESTGNERQMKQLASLIHLKEQVQRDRQLGFKEGSATTSTCGKYSAKTQVQSLLCSNVKNPMYPSLYYIFPAVNHNHDGGGTQSITDQVESYVADTYISSPGVNGGGYQYKALDDAQISSIALQERAIESWSLPTKSSPSGTVSTAVPNSSSMELIRVCAGAACDIASTHKVALKDAAFFDGREAMNVRFLNIDLSLLKDHALMPTSGIIYAFREDAVREDAIARPVGTTMNLGVNPPTDPALLNFNISKKPIDYYPDPDRRPYGFRLKNGKNISRANVPAKEVGGMTFVSDNPIYIQGNFNLHTNNTNATENTLDEFSDFYKPPTTNSPSNPIPPESSVAPNKSFYDPERKLDPNFGRKGKDNWRPVDIVGDAVGILSDNFCDGSIEDGIVNAGTTDPAIQSKNKYGCNDIKYTSYLNQNRPMTTTTNWLRENPADSKSPILISKQGMHQVTATTQPALTDPYFVNYSGNYLTFSQGGGTNETAGKKRIVASQTTANMILVSGIVPTRLNQLNGGLHNFPRMIEDWKDTTLLTIKGSLMQLRFSNYSTASYDQTPWEPTGNANPLKEVTDNTNDTRYYQPPARNWGYDLGLQYNPPTPVTQRGETKTSQGGQLYQEPKADDPYICLLRSKLTNFACK